MTHQRSWRLANYSNDPRVLAARDYALSGLGSVMPPEILAEGEAVARTLRGGLGQGTALAGLGAGTAFVLGAALGWYLGSQHTKSKVKKAISGVF